MSLQPNSHIPAEVQFHAANYLEVAVAQAVAVTALEGPHGILANRHPPLVPSCGSWAHF